MRHPKIRRGTWAIGLASVALILAPLGQTASAAAPNTFATRYAQNEATMAKLLAEAQADGGSGASVAALEQAVQGIDAQVSALYAAEQSLAAAKAGIAASGAADRTALLAQRQTLQREIAQARVGRKGERKGAASRRERELQLRTWTAQLRQVDFELGHPGVLQGLWQRHPYAGGLGELETSILDLQKASIHYTNLWIAAAKAPGTAAGTPATIQGLAYAVSAIAIPAAGAQSVTDAVYQPPIVKDAQGNVLADTGTYALTGPNGAAGAAINASSGLVTVSAGAAAGLYTVTYAQGTVQESVGLTLTPAGSTAGTPASVSGLSYAAPAVTIPPAGGQAVTDAVATPPVVRDALGNVLADSGSYALTGPAGASGVSIDQASGLLSVQAGATPGSYAVTYTQGSAAQAVGITVNP